MSKNNNAPYRLYLTEEQMPKQYYNLRADMKELPEPLLNPGTKKPVTLDNVQASCGCTTPQWSKEAIAPKKKGFINVTYNPAGRPGSFTKSITVKYHDASEETKTIVLNIKGEVIPKAKPAN